jgi:ComF family protein
LCPGCRADPPAFTVARAAGPFEEPLRMAIHALKYQGKERVAPSLAELLVEAWKREPILHSAEVVIPLPIHQKREKDRGFNQSALLSRDLAASLSLPLFDRVLTRPIHRQPQVGLGRAERRENVSGVFAVEYPALVRGRSLLLVDDVLTTGATCHEAARTLLDAGAAEVKVLALAREPYRRDGSHQL